MGDRKCLARNACTIKDVILAVFEGDLKGGFPLAPDRDLSKIRVYAKNFANWLEKSLASACHSDMAIKVVSCGW